MESILKQPALNEGEITVLLQVQHEKGYEEVIVTNAMSRWPPSQKG